MGTPRFTESALDRACRLIEARVAARAAEFRAADLAEATIALMVKQPWRITRAVYPYQHPHIWPPQPGMAATEVLADCARAIAGSDSRRGHWTYSEPAHVALLQAELALLRLIEGEPAGRPSPFANVTAGGADAGMILSSNPAKESSNERHA